MVDAKVEAKGFDLAGHTLPARFDNPFFESGEQAVAQLMCSRGAFFSAFPEFGRQFGFGYLTDAALRQLHDLFVQHSIPKKIVSIGAGAGYCESLLAQIGCDIKAFDIKPGPGEPGGKVWHQVEQGDFSEAANFPDRLLFLSWPEKKFSVLPKALQAYRAAGGSHCLVVGPEREYATDPLFQDQARFLREIPTDIRLPGWTALDLVPSVKLWRVLREDG